MSCCCFILRRSSDTPRSSNEDSTSPKDPKPILIEGKEPFQFLVAHAEEMDQTLWRRDSSFSPRIPQKNLSEMVHNIQEYLNQKIDLPLDALALLSQTLGQIYYNQYEPICSNNYALLASLHAAHLLEICLIAISHLIIPGNSCLRIISPSLLKIGLKIIEYPYSSISFEEEATKKAVEHILGASKRLKSTETKVLVLEAEEAWLACEKKYPSTQEIAQQGLNLFHRYIRDELDKQEFYSLQSIKEETFEKEKHFLFAIRAFLLRKRYRLRLDPIQEQSLFVKGYNLLLSVEAAELLKDPQIRKIGLKILSMICCAPDSPGTERAIQRAAKLFKTPFLPLKGLQLLLLWTQRPFAEIEIAKNILAGTRQWDPYGELYQFAMTQFLEFSKNPWEHQTILYQLLRFIYCWRAAPANQDLLSLSSLHFLWQQCLAQKSLEPRMQEKLRKEFNTVVNLESSLLPPSRLPAAYQNPLFSGPAPENTPIPKEPCFLWKQESGFNKFHDSILIYLLSAREQITISDLASFPKTQSLAILTQAMRFKQIVQFFVGQLLAENQTPSRFRFMIKTLHLLQEKFLENSAFEAALAIHAVFQQAAISRLKSIFSSESSEYSLLENTEQWCHPTDNFFFLRNLQSQSPTAFEVSFLLFSDLTHLRENPYEFTEEGEVNLDRLGCLGKILNHFALRKQRALGFWASQTSLKPNLFLIKVFDAQSGQLDEEVLQEKWWERSHEFWPNSPKIS